MEKEVYVLALPYPGQGHVNPMLQFCNILASKGGLKVILALATSFNTAYHNIDSNSIQIEHISVGSENVTQPETLETYWERFRTTVSFSLSEVIERYKETLKVVIYDSTLTWALDLAKEHGLLGASLFTQSCSVCAIYYHMYKEASEDESNSKVSNLSFFNEMGNDDFPLFSCFKELSESVSRLLYRQFSNVEKVDFLLFNTFDKLEEEAINWMASQWPITTIGPLVPSLHSKEEDRINLFKPETETCLNWLDTKESSSVIYVSFGSSAVLEEEQLQELAWGLAQSNFQFLWVVRSSEDSKLPKDFKSKTSEKGLVVSWCPQLEVLSHRAISCFITHCGWNSTMEALSLGVPIVAMPVWVDQTTNGKFIADVWKVGVRVKVNEKRIVTREEIETCIKEVIQGDRQELIKNNATQWKELALKAVLEGGSSYNNIEKFISKISCTGLIL